MRLNSKLRIVLRDLIHSLYVSTHQLAVSSRRRRFQRGPSEYIADVLCSSDDEHKEDCSVERLSVSKKRITAVVAPNKPTKKPKCRTKENVAKVQVIKILSTSDDLERDSSPDILHSQAKDLFSVALENVPNPSLKEWLLNSGSLAKANVESPISVSDEDGDAVVGSCAETLLQSKGVEDVAMVTDRRLNQSGSVKVKASDQSLSMDDSFHTCPQQSSLRSISSVMIAFIVSSIFTKSVMSSNAG